MTTRRTIQIFDRDAGEGQRARGMVGAYLRRWGLDEEREPFALIVSELFANAVRHGAGPVEVRMAADPGHVRVEVRDAGGGRPVLREPDRSGEEPGGWGLHFVDQLADDWGAEVDDHHTLVWAERAIRSSRQAAQEQ